MFSHWLTRWNLQADGASIKTHSSQLLPVLCDGRPLMLKLALVEEERRGADLMQWWNGNGAAKVVAHHNEALLMERACGGKNLLHMAKHSQDEDDEASQIICRVVTQLHTRREETLPPLETLHQRFNALRQAVSHGSLMSLCCSVAETLLSSPQDEVVLHGDIHHGNILDFGERGWLAIDPKGLFGERGYDYANLFCNPELSTCTRRERFLRQLAVVTQAANLDRQRLLMWIMAYAGLSAAWFLEDNELDYVASRMSIARFAADELGI
ncbi:3'-kinase [Hafnia alvei]|uniref:aminoglycoside phosphotransferase family protein n=1 Tax=Hafnia alvei TaxID=569 RepID=UPI0007BCA487|nr:aminoglycoside phosphotransferase family protein [Hafnia alvei]ANC39671.1 3'-kinase [Hafnia alvei]